MKYTTTTLLGIVMICGAWLTNAAATVDESAVGSKPEVSATSSVAAQSNHLQSRTAVHGTVMSDGSTVSITVDTPPTPPAPPRPWDPGEVGEGDGANAMVGIGHDSTLAADAHADDVVSVFGSSNSAGEVTRSVVSVFGDTRVTGSVGAGAVAVFGDTSVDGEVGGDVVAVLGDVTLGPRAQVRGQVVAVGGTVIRDPAAQVRGGIQNVGFGVHGLTLNWLRPWIDQCLLYGRMLAFAPGLAWAWTLALVTLALYVFTALLFPAAVAKCVRTLEAHPGESLLVALLATLATPVAIVLLCITVIGILAVPFVATALWLAESFGKLVMLAWIGRLLWRNSEDSLARPAVAVLLGGVLVTLLYCVPVLGMITYKALGFVGLGAVSYAVLLHLRARREQHRADDAASAAASTRTTADGNASSPGMQADAGSQPPPQSQPHQQQATSGVSADAAVMLPRAGFALRMAALLLDVILIGIVMHFVAGSEYHLLVLATYAAVLWKLKGTTIGGSVFHLQVARSDGRAIDWTTAIVRALSCFLSLFVVGLGFIWIALDAEKQAWHDKIAGTVVVRVPKGVSLL